MRANGPLQTQNGSLLKNPAAVVEVLAGHVCRLCRCRRAVAHNVSATPDLFQKMFKWQGFSFLPIAQVHTGDAGSYLSNQKVIDRRRRAGICGVDAPSGSGACIIIVLLGLHLFRKLGVFAASPFD
jgi:hypothetical protein